jgi:exopolyphosphatase / guanosine-5'-triphosphate,3'-diphosphate pyrophosphatase
VTPEGRGATFARMIVPRWEWRTFGDTFGEAEARLAELPPTRLDDSEELYILSSRIEGSIKVRGGKLDVKRLERRSEDGLEQWKPVATADFPIAATNVASLLAALDVSVPSLDREAYALDELIEEVVGPVDDLVAVPVHKHRAHHLLDGCRAELTELRSGPRTTRTIAVENEDPTVVRATVEAVGLWSRLNISVPRGLARLLGLDWRWSESS